MAAVAVMAAVYFVLRPEDRGWSDEGVFGEVAVLAGLFNLLSDYCLTSGDPLRDSQDAEDECTRHRRVACSRLRADDRDFLPWGGGWPLRWDPDWHIPFPFSSRDAALGNGGRRVEPVLARPAQVLPSRSSI